MTPPDVFPEFVSPWVDPPATNSPASSSERPKGTITRIRQSACWAEPQSSISRWPPPTAIRCTTSRRQVQRAVIDRLQADIGLKSVRVNVTVDDILGSD